MVQVGQTDLAKGSGHHRRMPTNHTWPQAITAMEVPGRNTTLFVVNTQYVFSFTCINWNTFLQFFKKKILENPVNIEFSSAAAAEGRPLWKFR